MRTKTLVMGWFSFERADATAGDLIAKDVVCRWLDEAERAYDVALGPPFSGGIDIDSVGGGEYEHVVFVCGPFFRNNLLRRFEPSTLVGVNLSMVEPVEEWNPFDLLLERDSTAVSRPDVVFLGPRPSKMPGRDPKDVSTVGVVVMDPIDVTADRAHHEAANATVERLAGARPCEAIPIDTRLDLPNRSDLGTPGEIEAAIAGADLVITTRLHGLVFAIKNGVPAVAVDAIPGGGKLSRQAEAIGWPLIFSADTPLPRLEEAFDRCLTDEARQLALDCHARASESLAPVRRRFVEAMRSPVEAGWGDGRRAGTWLEGSGDPTVGWARRVARRISAALPTRQR